MKKLLLTALILLIGITLFACAETPAETDVTPTPEVSPTAQTQDPAPPETPEEVVRAYAQALIDGEFAAANDMMNDEMFAAAAGMGGSEGLAQQLETLYGTLESVTSAVIRGNTEEYFICTVDIAAENDVLRLQIVVDADNMVAGLQIVSTTDVEDPIPPPPGFVETTVTVDAGVGFPLEGRLVMPDFTDEPIPLVVLVQGSGALDFDEIVGANRVFNQIAYGLAERGIASLRYNKRTYEYPETAAAPGFSVNDEYIDDVIAAAAFARSLDDVGSVYILGHSQGGMLAPAFIAEGADADGMIILAGSPRSLLDIMDDQQEELMELNAHLGDDVIDAFREMQAQFRAGRDALAAMTAEEAMDAGMIYGQFPAYYVYTLEQIDALALIRSLAVPTLIMQGSRDFQVYTDADYQMYLDGLSGQAYVRFELYPGLNHLFMPSEANNIGDAMTEYETRGEIPAAVFDDIAEWIRG